ncbi:patatin-like phospholipase family protein [Sphingomonas sp. NFX23]|uniref:patatin-like phospholipase family protein n=1 Tax=Sphingomonas sp. NFX23 TaxID=2819532 RepID=UPI003CF56BBE
MTVALSGCSTLAPRVPYSLSDLQTAHPVGQEIVRFWAKDDDTAYRNWSSTLLGQRQASGSGVPRVLLSVSGGSDKGAYSAGLLNAWTHRGDRPVFDIVTGVSTGALIAPFAFLGSDQDGTLRTIYTNLSRKDVYRTRILSGLFGGASVLDTKPLRALIDRYVTPAFLERIAQEHRHGRRLLVMTANLDAQRGVIWDMGAIAASASPERVVLFQQVLLASASIPGAFPPVLIKSAANGQQIEEMHVDGGTIGSFFVLPKAMLALGASDDKSAGVIYILYNGRLEPDFSIVRQKTFTIVSRALATVLGQNDRNGIDDLQAIATQTKGKLVVCSIEKRAKHDDAPLFDTSHMRELFALGEQEMEAINSCIPSNPTGGP